MNRTLFQLTLRRWVEILTNRNFYLLFAIVVICSAAIGPFGTFDRLTLTHRLGFWLMSHAVCWAVGLAIVVPLRLYLERLGLSKVMSFFISGGLANLIIGPLFAFALVWETAATVSVSGWVQSFLLAAPLVALITFVVVSLFGLENFSNQIATKKVQVVSPRIPIWADPMNCAIQQRLSAKNRGVIFAMVAQDHYVEIITNKGSELLLMRLSDAHDICGDEDSLRIHRSAWVSRTGAIIVEKDGRNTKVVLPNGRRLPVSRSMEAELKHFMTKTPFRI